MKLLIPIRLLLAIVALALLGTHASAESTSFNDLSKPIVESATRVAEPTPVDYRNKRYKVKKGDTFPAIALAFGLDATELAAWNDQRNPELIYVGQALRLHPPGVSDVSGAPIFIDLPSGVAMPPSAAVPAPPAPTPTPLPTPTPIPTPSLLPAPTQVAAPVPIRVALPTPTPIFAPSSTVIATPAPTPLPAPTPIPTHTAQTAPVEVATPLPTRPAPPIIFSISAPSSTVIATPAPTPLPAPTSPSAPSRTTVTIPALPPPLPTPLPTSTLLPAPTALLAPAPLPTPVPTRAPVPSPTIAPPLMVSPLLLAAPAKVSSPPPAPVIASVPAPQPLPPPTPTPAPTPTVTPAPAPALSATPLVLSAPKPAVTPSAISVQILPRTSTPAPVAVAVAAPVPVPAPAPPPAPFISLQSTTSEALVETYPIKGPDDIRLVERANKDNVKREPKGGKQAYSNDALVQLQSIERAVDSTVAVAPLESADWRWPHTGAMIATFRAGINNGIDIVGKAGDAIAAAADGRVLYAGSGFHGNGKLIIVRHASDYLSLYAITAELMVVEGQTVKRGQRIAVIGGNDAAESSVHFEIHFHGKPVDPQKHLPPR